MISNAQERKLRLEEKLRRELGSSVLQAMEDPAVVEVMLNADGNLWEDRALVGMAKIGTMGEVQAENLIGTIASMLGTVATRDQPVVEGELPLDGSRFEGVLPPIVEKPVFAIRKKARFIFTLQQYVESKILTESQYKFLLEAIHQRKNILVVGGTGSGKTTLCNALLAAIADSDPMTRIAVIEDTRELQCPAVNTVSLKTSDGTTMQYLLRVCLRLRPDRIVVGEVRGAEALTLIKSWNTGHGGGVATVHANDAMAGLIRLENLVQEANVPANPRVIAEAVNVVVSIQKHNVTGRKVEEIAYVKSVNGSDYVLEYH